MGDSGSGSGEEKSELSLCQECGKAFKSEVYLKNHVYYNHIHRELKYKCSYCDKMFGLKCSRKKHEERKHKPKSFECKFCDKKFTRKWVKERHERSVHS